METIEDLSTDELLAVDRNLFRETRKPSLCVAVDRPIACCRQEHTELKFQFWKPAPVDSMLLPVDSMDMNAQEKLVATLKMLRQDIELYAQAQQETHVQIKEEVLNLTAGAFFAGSPCASLDDLSTDELLAVDRNLFPETRKPSLCVAVNRPIACYRQEHTELKFQFWIPAPVGSKLLPVDRYFLQISINSIKT
ncbi:hypothetical protein Taro_037799 [Colocasia esculenta]|uniref:Uncharacterized protein n=1 Tax=Colocasia esculenta TaxID=4460 RepID=A0A843W1K9_COLES|nr:hypothetical protein [Colocasia esculenta]